MAEALSKPNVYETITAKIIAAIEAGAGEYRSPWHVARSPRSLPANAATLAQYRGVNVLGLWIEGMQRGYASSLWASYRQWQRLGAQVRKGERGSMVVFYKRIVENAFEQEDHDKTPKLSHFARASYVFNAAQVEGFKDKPEAPRTEFERVGEAEAFIQAVGAKIVHGFAAACYRHRSDSIEMPDRTAFVGTSASSPAEAYYSVLLHELTHWSGAASRLNRAFGKRFGDDSYAMEELVAELGAAFMCAGLGIANEPRPDHAAYIGHWLKVLKEDSRAIFTAASKAQEAFEHLAYLAMKNSGP